jgi:hypothetical protein
MHATSPIYIHGLINPTFLTMVIESHSCMPHHISTYMYGQTNDSVQSSINLTFYSLYLHLNQTISCVCPKQHIGLFFSFYPFLFKVFDILLALLINAHLSLISMLHHKISLIILFLKL